MISNLQKKPDIIIVDDNLNFRQGLVFLITVDDVATVIGKASNEREFIELLSDLKPDVVLMDINMLQNNGMEATQRALQLMPDLKIIAFTMFGDEEYYNKMYKLGVKGFLLKSAGIVELEKAIEKVMNGENYVSDQLLRKIIINYARNNSDNFIEKAGLSAIETEIMQHVCQGLSNEDIANKLSVSILTIKNHKANLLNKISCQYTSHEVLNDSGYMLN
ncbi:MAG: response regulator transcription factor [Verrucomicrobia bacterium]|nr:response regulator transcription factor [Prolixibacteraceae bacterium]